jgi:hypothetical protein
MLDRTVVSLVSALALAPTLLCSEGPGDAVSYAYNKGAFIAFVTSPRDLARSLRHQACAIARPEPQQPAHEAAPHVARMAFLAAIPRPGALRAFCAMRDEHASGARDKQDFWDGIHRERGLNRSW